MTKIVQETIDLCKKDAISGFEEGLQAEILQQIKAYATEITTDRMGNILAFKKGKKKSEKKILIAAHYDEVGLMVKAITSDGYLKFCAIGGIDPRILLGKHVKIGNLHGVIGLIAIHLSGKNGQKNIPKIDDLCIDIGRSKEEAEKLIEPGDPITFDSPAYVQGNSLFAKAIDDRFGIAMLIKLLKSQLAYDTHFAFTVQEELGLRGAKIISHRNQFDITLIAECTTAADLPETEGHKQVCTLGKGPVIACMDGGAIYSYPLFEAIKTLANSENIPWQIKTKIAGGTDAGAFATEGYGSLVTGVSVPVRYLHSPLSCANTGDIEAADTLLTKLVTEGKLHEINL